MIFSSAPDTSKQSYSKENGILGVLDLARDCRGNLGISQIVRSDAQKLWIRIKIACAAYRPFFIVVAFTYLSSIKG